MTARLMKTPGARGASARTSEPVHETARARRSHGGGSRTPSCGVGWHRRAENVVSVRAPAANRKLAPVDMVANDSPRLRPEPRAPFMAATYLPIAQTCSDRCRFKGDGCMAQAGFTGGAVRRLEGLAAERTALDVVLEEAREIDRTWRNGVPQLGGRDGRSGIDMRLHVSGDCKTTRGARALAGAAERYQSRGGGRMFTFTHSWREVPRTAWGVVSVLASIERGRDAAKARAFGYAPAIVVDEFPSECSFVVDGTTFIPCPAETRGRTCVECRLCIDRSDWLRDTGRGIAFAAHGPQAAKARRHLQVLS